MFTFTFFHIDLDYSASLQVRDVFERLLALTQLDAAPLRLMPKSVTSWQKAHECEPRYSMLKLFLDPTLAGGEGCWLGRGVHVTHLSETGAKQLASECMRKLIMS